MVTRHSKQMPIPHSGPRGSWITERRNEAAPAMATAAETILPSGTATETLLTCSLICSGMHRILTDSVWQIWLHWKCGTSPQHLIYQQLGGAERSRNAKPFVPGGQIKIIAARAGADQRQLVRRSGAEPRPDA